MCRSFARRLVPITAQGIGMRDAHVAASIGAGSAMPFPWLVCRGGPLNVIGRRTGARSIDHPTVRRAPSRRAPARIATGSSLLGIRLGRSHLCGGIGLRRRRGWRHLLGIRLRHPGCGSQNAHARDSDQNAFYRSPPWIYESPWGRNARVKATVPKITRCMPRRWFADANAESHLRVG